MHESPRQAANRLCANQLAQGFQAVALHTYRDPDGKPLYYRFRLKHPESGDKVIRPLMQNGNGWELKEPTFTGMKPLYGLERLAKYLDAVVYVVEGENCVDALARAKVLAVSSGGASSARKADWEPLRGRTVCVWPDNDAAGTRYGRDVLECLTGLCSAVSVLDVPKLKLPEKGDAVDWLDAHPGATATDVAALPVAAPRLAAVLPDRLVAVSLVRGDTIRPEAVRWLWDGFLAAGKLHVMAGAPGTGKTTLALALAAIITSAGRWPDGSRSEQGQVLIWSGEDDPADTLVPRLMAAGADMSRVHFVGPARDGSEVIPFDPARHFPALVAAANVVGEVSLVIVDPIVSAVTGDSNKNAEVRRGLQPLVDAAGQLGAAVLGISHFSKGTAGRDVVERITGSVAFGAVARVALATAKLPDEEGGGRILVRAKNNLGPDGGGFGYELQQVVVREAPGITASSVVWGDPITGNARELLALAEGEADGSEKGAAHEAEKWLLELLDDEGGSVDRRRVMDAARAAGFSERTVQRARTSLDLTATQMGFGAEKRSIWTRSEKPIRANSAQSCQPESLANMGKIGTIGTSSSVRPSASDDFVVL
jgi:energy-coupling factor transporter ATP-binding protein EcfA2